MSGIPRMGKIGLKNEKYNKAFEKHIKRSNTLVSLTEKCLTAKCYEQQEFYLLHSKKKSHRVLKQIKEKIVTWKKNIFWQIQKRDDRWLLREVQIYKPSIIYLDFREK